MAPPILGAARNVLSRPRGRRYIDRPDRIILGQIVFKSLGKQRALTAVIANDKARHRPPAKSQEDHITDGRFHAVWVKRRTSVDLGQ